MIQTRLKVIDLSERAAQPMSSNDGRWQIAFNGEIYNFRALRGVLQALGRQFRSDSDTEVLLAALETWGEGAIRRLDGIFAFALLDRVKGSFLAARDLFGVKPLVYEVRDCGLAVSSELRALVAARGTRVEIDPSALATYLSFGSTYGTSTMVRGICDLPPGHLIRCTGGRTEIERWGNFWPPTGVHPVGAGRPAEVARGLLGAAVERQLVADVPVGVFLSSGMDSTAILALAARTHRQEITAITVAFEDEHARFNEDLVAASFAAELGVRHQVARLDESWILAHMDRAVASLDRPSMDGVNTWAVSCAVKDAGITVALSGLGGDEVFGGYSHLRQAFEREVGFKALRASGAVAKAAGTLLGAIPGGGVSRSKALALIRHGGIPGGAYAVRRALFIPEDSSALVSAEVRGAGHQRGLEGMLATPPEPGLRPAQEATLLEFENYLSCTLLRDTDAMSMAHALEVRVPFLDAALVDYVLSLPLEARFERGRQKPLLAAAVPEIAPVLNGPKRGFTLPFERWLVGPLREVVETRVAALPFSNQWVNPEVATGLFGRLLAGDTRQWSRVWALYVLDRWIEGIEKIAG